MAYRGMDLDLRTPVLRPRATREPGMEVDPSDGLTTRRARVQAYSGARPADPIWVDDIILACGNHAFDVAMAHGSAEVRLEHLVLALTKVDAAARVLEERGIREGQLRRECAALIVSEIPTAPIGERGTPRRSEEFADVLRRSAQRAALRGAAAGVDDVLAVLLEYPDDQPAVLVLRAHAPEWTRLSRSSGDRGLGDSASAVSHGGSAPRLELTTVHDPIALRLDALDGTIRAVQTDLAADRRVLADLVRDIQRELGSQRNELAARLQSALPVRALERMQATEAGIESRLSDLARLWSLTSERLQSIEKTVEVRHPESGVALGSMADRLEALDHHWSQLQSRLEAMERGWQAREAQAHSAPRAAMERLADVEAMVHGGLARIAERLAALEMTVERAAPSEVSDQVTDRMIALERTVTSGLQDGARNWAALGQRLETFAAAIAGKGPTDGGQILERMAAIERGLAAPREAVEAGLRQVSERWDALGERITGIEAVLTDPQTTLSGISSQLEHRLNSVEAAVVAHRADAAEHRLALMSQIDAVGAAATRPVSVDTGRLQSLVSERLDKLRQDLVASVANAALGPIVERLESLKVSGEARHRERLQIWTGLAERTAAIETAQQQFAAAASEASRAHQRGIANLSEATSALSNDHELMRIALGDLRYDQQGEQTAIIAALRQILTRLEAPRPLNGHETGTGIIMPAPSEPASTPRNGASAESAVSAVATPSPGTKMAGKTAQPTVTTMTGRLSFPERKGLWMWLFGTDNVRQSNADAELRWRAVHRRWRDNARPET